MIHSRIAILGADPSQIFALQSCLLTAGYIAQRFETAADFLRAVTNASFDTLILTSNVPDLTGLEVLARLRQELNLTIPVIMVTPSKGEDYIVSVLRGGADECITTPVGDREFLARLEAVTRRWVNAPQPVRSFQVGRLTVNMESRRILLGERPVELTSKDYDLAVLLLRNVGRFISRSDILRAIWGRKQVLGSRTLDTHMSRVRTKLKLIELYGWRLHAEYRRGYRLERLKNNEHPHLASSRTQTELVGPP
jgi:DNA-binding response OmpR family regulator